MKKRLLTLSVLLIALLTLFGCGTTSSQITKMSEAKKAYTSSMKKVKTVTTDIEYKDGSFVIKKVSRTQTFIDGDEARVATATTAIDPTTFEQTTTSESEIKTISRESLVAFNLKEKLFINSEISDGVISGTVPDDCAEEFIGNIGSFGGIKFKASFADSLIRTAEYSFKFIADEKTGKMCEAFVTITYEY